MSLPVYTDIAAGNAQKAADAKKAFLGALGSGQRADRLPARLKRLAGNLASAISATPHGATP